jgi:hypothetical protein
MYAVIGRHFTQIKRVYAFKAGDVKAILVRV